MGQDVFLVHLNEFFYLWNKNKFALCFVCVCVEIKSENNKKFGTRRKIGKFSCPNSKIQINHSIKCDSNLIFPHCYLFS